MKVLVIDVGGSHVKMLASGRREPLKLDSGPKFTAAAMARTVKVATDTWTYDVISIGYPGPVLHGRPVREPHNLGAGWVRFDFERAFGKPVRIINDAAMQALGSYTGGRMLFLGLGTGLGAAAIDDGNLMSLEIAHLPYRKGRSYEEYVGERGLKRLGRKRWQAAVHEVIKLFREAFVCEYIVIGGGNARLLRSLPPATRLGDNANAFLGGIRLWQPPELRGRPATRRTRVRSKRA
jgi:polyphosphate glucokinase